jgi:hypothetical protein
MSIQRQGYGLLATLNPRFRDISNNDIARSLVLFDILFMVRGYAVANLLEVLLFLFFIFDKRLRSDLVRELFRLPTLPLFCYFIWMAMSIMWADAGYSAWLEDLVSWRKLVLFPVCIVLFRSRKHFSYLLFAFLFSILIYLVASYAAWILDTRLWGRDYHSMAQDHSVQGVLFIFSSLIIGISLFQGNYHMAGRYLNPSVARICGVLVIFLLLYNVIYLTTGRSGYIAFGALAVFLMLRLRCNRLALLSMVAGLYFFVISSSQFVDRTSQAIAEFLSAFDGESLVGTSLGVRAIFWYNTALMDLKC